MKHKQLSDLKRFFKNKIASLLFQTDDTLLTSPHQLILPDALFSTCMIRIIKDPCAFRIHELNMSLQVLEVNCAEVKRKDGMMI